MKVRGIFAGVMAPDFEATTLDGKPFKLSDLCGRVVLLDFWATWCGPCVAELPNIKKVYEDCHAAGLDVVGVSFDRDAATARKFAVDRNLAWTQIWVEKADKSPVSDDYGVSAIPATFLIDPDGKVIGRDLRGDALLQAIQNAVAKLEATHYDDVRKREQIDMLRTRPAELSRERDRVLHRLMGSDDGPR